MQEEYQGWTNRETWAFYLWITNNEGDYNYWTEKTNELDTEDLREALKTNLEDLENQIIENPEQLTREARVMIMDIGDLSAVNCWEIAKALKEETEEEEETIKAKN